MGIAQKLSLSWVWGNLKSMLPTSSVDTATQDDSLGQGTDPNAINLPYDPEDYRFVGPVDLRKTSRPAWSYDLSQFSLQINASFRDLEHVLRTRPGAKVERYTHVIVQAIENAENASLYKAKLEEGEHDMFSSFFYTLNGQLHHVSEADASFGVDELMERKKLQLALVSNAVKASLVGRDDDFSEYLNAALDKLEGATKARAFRGDLRRKLETINLDLKVKQRKQKLDITPAFSVDSSVGPTKTVIAAAIFKSAVGASVAAASPHDSASANQPHSKGASVSRNGLIKPLDYFVFMKNSFGSAFSSDDDSAAMFQLKQAEDARDKYISQLASFEKANGIYAASADFSNLLNVSFERANGKWGRDKAVELFDMDQQALSFLKERLIDEDIPLSHELKSNMISLIDDAVAYQLGSDVQSKTKAPNNSTSSSPALVPA